MKIFDIDRIEQTLEEMEELKQEIKSVLESKPAHYSRIAGISHQLAYAFYSGKSKVSNNMAIKIYRNLTKYFDSGEIK